MNKEQRMDELVAQIHKGMADLGGSLLLVAAVPTETDDSPNPTAIIVYGHPSYLHAMVAEALGTEPFRAIVAAAGVRRCKEELLCMMEADNQEVH